MKKFLPYALVAIAFLFSGCASHPIKMYAPPSSNRLEILKKSLSNHPPSTLNTADETATSYLLGLKAEEAGDNKSACNFFKELSVKQNFPIAEAALVHTLGNCELESSELELIWNNRNIAQYLKENFYELSLQIAAKKNLLKFEAQFSYNLIEFKKIQSEKIKLIQRSIELAVKQGDNENILLFQNKLKEISPLYNTAITEQNIFLIAKDFESNRNFPRARELYQQMIDGNFPLAVKVKAFNAYRISYKVERNLKTFLQKTFEMESFLKLEREKNPTKEYKEAWADSVINLARAVWTEHKSDEAKNILNGLITSKLANGNHLATAHWLYGSLYLEGKQQLEALKQYELAAKIKVTDINLQENIQWAIVWNNFLLKKDDSVFLAANKYIAKSSNLNFTSKLNFWKAKALLRQKKTDEAKTILNAIIASDSFGYYGIIAAIELEIPITTLPKTQINTELTGNHVLDWLIAMEEKSYGQKYLKEINSQFKTPAERERAMSLYAQTEWYQGGMRQIYNFSNKTKSVMTEKYINVVYPTPYMDIISTFGNIYKVPPELVLGITRQESAFVSSERSWADAFGLMQLIPEKAIELSKKYAIPYDEYNDLYNPEINLEMGTALLKDLREKFDGKFAQSVAAYNASEEAINTWQRERFNGNYVEFIEMIPYEETRNYIKLVFRNYITYKRITSTQNFTLEKDFFSKSF